MSTGSMFAPQWNYKEFDSFIITDAIINGALESMQIDNLDIKATEGHVFAACKKSFKPLTDMLDRVPKSPPPQLDLSRN